jgi:hypothetical protein
MIFKRKINSFLQFHSNSRIGNHNLVYVVLFYVASSYDDRLVKVHQELDHWVVVEYDMRLQEFYPHLNSKFFITEKFIYIKKEHTES